MRVFLRSQQCSRFLLRSRRSHVKGHAWKQVQIKQNLLHPQSKIFQGSFSFLRSIKSSRNYAVDGKILDASICQKDEAGRSKERRVNRCEFRGTISVVFSRAVVCFCSGIYACEYTIQLRCVQNDFDRFCLERLQFVLTCLFILEYSI